MTDIMSFKMRLVRLLRWSEAYAKADMVYVAHGSFWLIASRGVSMAASILSSVAMANLVPSAVVGIYRFVVAGAGIIGSISILNLPPAITRSVARGYDGTLTQGALAYLKWSIITVVVSFGVATYYWTHNNSILAISFLIVGVCTPIINSAGLFTHFLAGKRDFRAFSLFESIRITTPSLILVATLYVTDDPVFIVLSYFTSTAFVTYLLFQTTLARYRTNNDTEPTTIPFARHLALMGIIGKLPEHIDKILLFHYLGATQLAVYTFALMPILNLKLLNDIPTRLMLPKLPIWSLPELQSSLPRKVLLLSLGMFAIVIAYMFAAPYIFQLLFPLYMDAVLPSQIAALSLVLAPGSLFAEALVSHMRKNELYKSQIVVPVVKIGLFLVLVPLYGIWGAIAAIIASQFATFALNMVLFMRAR